MPWFTFQLTARKGLRQVLTHSAQHRSQVLSWLSREPPLACSREARSADSNSARRPRRSVRAGNISVNPILRALAESLGSVTSKPDWAMAQF